MAADKAVCEVCVIHRDAVDRAAARLPDRAAFAQLGSLYKAFADPTRVKILWALKEESLCVCDLAALLNMTASAVSHQLKVLRLSSLVRYERKGKIVYYSLADDHVTEILACGFSHINE